MIEINILLMRGRGNGGAIETEPYHRHRHYGLKQIRLWVIWNKTELLWERWNNWSPVWLGYFCLISLFYISNRAENEPLLSVIASSHSVVRPSQGQMLSYHCYQSSHDMLSWANVISLCYLILRHKYHTIILPQNGMYGTFSSWQKLSNALHNEVLRK